MFRDRLKRDVSGEASISEQCFSTKGCMLSHPIAFVMSSWTRISCTSDSLGDLKVTGYSCARRVKCVRSTKSVSYLILAVEVRCHKVQGMTEAFSIDKFICCLAREKRLFGELNCSFLHGYTAYR